MKYLSLLGLLGLMIPLSSCETHEVYYHEAPRPVYKPKTRTVNRYVPSRTPTTIPGMPYTLPDNNAPSSFKASSQ